MYYQPELLHNVRIEIEDAACAVPLPSSRRQYNPVALTLPSRESSVLAIRAGLIICAIIVVLHQK